MNELQFHHSYSDDAEKRASLIQLFEAAFGIPPEVLHNFYDQGFWDPSYRPLSYFDGERTVANVSFFDMPLRINGRDVRAAGIQSVMSHPDVRGQGLVRKLFDELYERHDAEYELFFLYAQSSEMYEKFGFKLVPQSHFVVEKIAKAEGTFAVARELNVAEREEDRVLLKRLFSTRTPVSDVFGFLNHEPTFYFNLLEPGNGEQVAYLPDLDVAVIYKQEDSVLHLFDVIGARIPSVSTLVAALGVEVEKAEVYFTPDLLQTEYTALEPHSNAKLMVRGDFALDVFRIPSTSAY